MKIRVLKNFNGYRPGQEFEWADGMARIMIARGMIEPVREEAVEQAVLEQRTERAVVTSRKKQK